MDLYARRAGGDLAAYAGPRGPHMLARANADAPLVAYTPVFWAPYVAAGGPPPSTVTGDLAVTLGALTLGSAATVTITATCAPTLGALTLSSASALTITATEASSLASATLAAVGDVDISAALGATLDDATLASTGAASVTAVVAATLAPLVLEANRNWPREYTEQIRELFASAKGAFDMRWGIQHTAEIVHVLDGDGVSDIQVGTVLYLNSDGTAYVSALNGTRTGRALALAVAVNQETAEVRVSGNVNAAYTLLGSGAATLVAVDFGTGRLKRSTSPQAGDELVGWCDTAGNAHLLFGGMGLLPIYRGSGAPTTGTWAVGDTVYSSTPTAGGYVGWVCVTAGTPGTWKTFGAISA